MQFPESGADGGHGRSRVGFPAVGHSVLARQPGGEQHAALAVGDEVQHLGNGDVDGRPTESMHLADQSDAARWRPLRKAATWTDAQLEGDPAGLVLPHRPHRLVTGGGEDGHRDAGLGPRYAAERIEHTGQPATAALHWVR